MPLGLKVYHGSGEFSPRVQYNAKSGRLLVVNRREDAEGAFVVEKIDVTMQQPELAFDIGAMMIGWAYFPANAGPDTVMVPFGQPMPERPSPKHKAGFKVKVWNGREAEPRDFMSTAGVVVDVFETLWDQIEATAEARHGDVPVIRFELSQPVKGSRDTNYAPVLKLVTWITRDERIFGPRIVPIPGTVAPQPAPTASAPIVMANGHALPPAAWQAPAPPPAPEATRAW
jgi:hypothetical protein